MRRRLASGRCIWAGRHGLQQVTGAGSNQRAAGRWRGVHSQADDNALSRSQGLLRYGHQLVHLARHHQLAPVALVRALQAGSAHMHLWVCWCVSRLQRRTLSAGPARHGSFRAARAAGAPRRRPSAAGPAGCRRCATEGPTGQCSRRTTSCTGAAGQGGSGGWWGRWKGGQAGAGCLGCPSSECALCREGSLEPVVHRHLAQLKLGALVAQRAAQVCRCSRGCMSLWP